jgi:hypothetical protein
MNPVSFAGTWFIKRSALPAPDQPGLLDDKLYAAVAPHCEYITDSHDYIILSGEKELDEAAALVLDELGLKKNEHFVQDDRLVGDIPEAEAEANMRRIGFTEQQIAAASLFGLTTARQNDRRRQD